MKNFQRIVGSMHRAIKKYNLIQEGDKIAIGVSGGKDSLCLLKALSIYQKHSKEKFEIYAISVDMYNGKYDFDKIKVFCQEIEVPLTIVPSQIAEIVFDIRKEKNPCSLCANMRRGILNSTAKELGCNKVALGHHLDDLIETFFLSMFYEGRLNTFLPKVYLSKMDIEVIRPLIFVEEQKIENEKENLPIFKNPCPADKNTKREEIKSFIKNLEKKYNCKKNIFNAIIEKERYNLFNKLK